MALAKGNILLGISGGIAAYKIPVLVSLLCQQGYSVRAVLSESGARFASREALQTLSGQKVYSNLWQTYRDLENNPVLHVALVAEADIFLIAPASYNWIGKAASGLADDLLSTLFAAWPQEKKPLLFAPAMNPQMWRKDALQQNIASLRQQGCQVLGPDYGFTACGAVGTGRMLAAEELYLRVEATLRFRNKNLKRRYGKEKPLAGKKVLLSVGPTREALDPIRYISNRSSGKSGIAIACAARYLGAEVTLISGLEQKQETRDEAEHKIGNTSAEALTQQLFGICVQHCATAVQMAQQAAENFAHCDWALAVAAVCDFRPVQVQQQKIKKQSHYQLELQLNPDILSYWGTHKNAGQKVLGFALESTGDPERERDYALAKMYRKKADAIVLNRSGNLEGVNAQAQVIFAHSRADRCEYNLKLQNKRDFAAELLLLLCDHWL